MSALVELARLTVLGFGLFALGVYVVVTCCYVVVHLAGLFELHEQARDHDWTPAYEPFSSPFLPGVAVVVPAFDEERTIVESVRALLTLEYPDTEIVVVNDGSTDATLERLEAAFDLRPIDASLPIDVPSEPIRDVYRSADYERLLVVDKDNGGKADALNAGIWTTDQDLFCAVDADTLVDRRALLDVVRPFLERPESVVATGGTIRVANGCEVADGQVVHDRFPRGFLPGVQVVEYLRSFYSGRIGLDRLRSLVLISGAFGVFRTDLVREIDGYRQDSITEDFDLVVRLHRHLVDDGREYSVRFVSEPVAWTEVPEDWRTLARQRRRWFRGLVETLVTNWRMVGNPRYGLVGVFGLPFFLLAEALGPLVEGLGYLLLPIAVVLDLLHYRFFLLFVLVTTGVGVVFSWFGVLSETATFRRFDDVREVSRLLAFGALEHVGFRQWKALVAWHGLVEFLRGDAAWGSMERSGFGDGPDGSDAAANGQRGREPGTDCGPGGTNDDSDGPDSDTVEANT